MKISFDEFLDDMEKINDDSSITVKVYTHLMHCEINFVKKQDIKINRDNVTFVSYSPDKMYHCYVSSSDNIEKTIDEKSTSYCINYPDLSHAIVTIS